MKKEYSILLIGFACSVFPFAGVFAQDSKTENKQFAPWSLKIGGGIGHAEERAYKDNQGKTNNYRISAEYNPRYFGFEFGLTHKVFSLSTHLHPGRPDHFLPIALYQSAGQNSSLADGALFSGSIHSDPLRERNNFNLTFLDIGPTFHMRPGKTFDPYLSIGAGTTGFDRFASYRGFARLGFKLNFDRFFVFTEAEGSSINRYYNRDLRIHYNDYSGMIGVGFHFGGGDDNVKKEESSTAGLSSF
ncbi:hypothetical protein EHQ76_08135 [Leptospira barantonii]|uniref:Outer membrane protein beta-barrel domain-containing protein n=1 Tax=Leptospira barantonii TaxID=2023184 RepID=A0A5F2BDG0_9LEPT|nr:hypothetical protein [Leptospira barantonii]TGM03608.1 hypothetical protein EHQ76_08135 [Leptospira barantonii]